MKRIQSVLHLVLILILSLSFACDHKFRNPLDPDTEIKTDEWAPDNLTVTVIDDSHVRLIWTQEDSRIEGFVIERKDGNANYKEVGRTDTTVFVDDSLKVGINYVYKILAYAEKNLSNPVTSQIISTSFPAPTGLNATVINDQTIRLTWTDNCSFESGFRIERKTGTGSYTQISEVNANTTNYEDDSLTYGETYTYRVRAYTPINQSGYSNEKSVTTTFPAPSNLNIEAIDDQSVRLTWTDNCSFEAGYKIERKTGSGSFVQIAEVNANATEYEENGLNYGETYTYQVRAYTLINQSDYSNENSAQMTIQAPSNLTTTGIDDQTIRLNWADNCLFESGYRIERKNGTGNFVQIAELSANATEYEETGLTYGETYTYRIRAYTPINQSIYSNEKSAETTFPAPTNLIATVIDDQTIRLTWTNNCSFESGFRIERKTGSGSFVQISEVNANSTEYTETGLTYGETYTYRIRAYTQINQSGYSNEKSVTTTFPAPSNLNAVAIDDQSVRLTWTDNCSFESGFRIERKTGTGSFVQIAEVNANTTEYTETGLTYGETYTYRVRAYTQVNQSGYSNENSAQMIIPAPTNLSATAIDDQSIRLTWADNCSFESGFRIERKISSGSFIQIAEVNANSTEYEETGLTYGETYTYRIRAYTQIDQSGYSNEKSTQMVIPAPTNLTAIALDDQTIRLTWTDNCLFEAGYRIERKTGSGSFIQIAEVNANTTEYTETGLTYGETYTYRVRAYTQVNQSGYSNEKSATLIIPAPSDLSATAIDDQTIRLTWIDNCLFEAGYRIERKIGSGSFVQIAEIPANQNLYDDISLTSSETYIYRILAFTPNHQSDYSNEACPKTVIDIDGNVYKTVKIGTQVWMVENLKATHYRNGDAIPNITDNTTWSNLTTGAYCIYINDVNNVTTYGRLYNWHAVNDSRNIAPNGWHVPTDAEWQTLVDYLGGEAVAGGKLKETGTTHWQTPNTGATNESGFSALPGSCRYDDGTYDIHGIGNGGYWWSATEGSSGTAWYRYLYFDSSAVYRTNYHKHAGFSLRCVRD